MIDLLPAELVSLIGNNIKDVQDLSSCRLAVKAMKATTHSKNISHVINVSKHNPLTLERFKHIQRVYHDTKLYYIAFETSDWNDQDVKEQGAVVASIAALESVEQLRMEFRHPIDFVTFFMDNLHTTKCMLIMYFLATCVGGPEIRFPMNSPFHEVHLAISDEWYHHIAHVFPACTSVILQKNTTVNTFTCCFDNVDPSKTSVYIYTLDMNICIYGGACVKYFLCHDMFMYGDQQDELIKHYQQHPLRNLDNLVIGDLDICRAHRQDRFYLYQLLQHMTTKRLVLVPYNEPYLMPMLNHLLQNHRSCFHTLALFCNTVQKCALGRLCQLLVHEDISLITSEPEFYQNAKAVTLKFASWDALEGLQERVHTIKKNKDIKELLGDICVSPEHSFVWYSMTRCVQHLTQQ